jgi:hypothetical protein
MQQHRYKDQLINAVWGTNSYLFEDTMEYINPMHEQNAKDFVMLKQVVYKITTILHSADSINQSPRESEKCSAGLYFKEPESVTMFTGAHQLITIISV